MYVFRKRDFSFDGVADKKLCEIVLVLLIVLVAYCIANVYNVNYVCIFVLYIIVLNQYYNNN